MEEFKKRSDEFKHYEGKNSLNAWLCMETDADTSSLYADLSVIGTCESCVFIATPPRMVCLHKSGGLLNPTKDTGCSHWEEKKND